MSLRDFAEGTCDRAKFGLETCWELLDILWSGKHLLDGGASAELAVGAKQASNEALAAEASVIKAVHSAIAAFELSAKRLTELMVTAQAPGFEAVDLGCVGESHRERAKLYRQVLVSLTEPPPTIPMVTPERSVAAVMQVRDCTGLRPAEAINRRKRHSRLNNCCNSFCVFPEEESQETVSARGLLEDQSRRRKRLGGTAGGPHLENLVDELFNLHDLNSDGVLEEAELIQLNERIARLHHGKDADKEAVRAKYRSLFRDKLDPNGQPVSFATFRGFMLDLLAELDPHEEAQEMIAEQFVAEAQTARATFHTSQRDTTFPQASSFTITEVSVTTNKFSSVATDKVSITTDKVSVATDYSLLTKNPADATPYSTPCAKDAVKMSLV